MILLNGKRMCESETGLHKAQGSSVQQERKKANIITAWKRKREGNRGRNKSDVDKG